jgi:hypothetical protein
MVRTSNGKQSTKPAKVEQQPAHVAVNPEQSPSNIRVSFKPDGKGGGTLQLRYAGPLASYGSVFMRLGERRHGADWVETRDVKMEKTGGEIAAKVSFAPGEPLEGATFAFFALKGQDGEKVWDNAGKPFGCYTLDPRTGEVAAR